MVIFRILSSFPIVWYKYLLILSKKEKSYVDSNIYANILPYLAPKILKNFLDLNFMFFRLEYTKVMSFIEI